MTQIAKMIFDDGVKAGLEAGIRQGADSRLIDQVYKKLRKGKSQEEMAEALEESVETIREICQAIALCGKPYDNEKVLRLWKKD